MEQRLKQDIHIGDTIRALRMERHLTQEQVVAKLQLYDISTVSYTHLTLPTIA